MKFEKPNFKLPKKTDLQALQAAKNLLVGNKVQKATKPQKKAPLPAENSIILRVVCALMAVIAIVASFIFGESDVPTIQFTITQGSILVLCLWLCIGGGIFSYHYRNNVPSFLPLLIKVGGALIVLNLARELWAANALAIQFQFLRPLMHALVAVAVLTSFEMRTRSDIISSATFGLLLLCVAAASGKSLVFGALVFVYICLGTALLILSCQSQTRTTASAAPSTVRVKQITRPSLRFTPILAMLWLPLTASAAFCLMPRLDNEADNVAAEIRSFATNAISNMRHRSEEDYEQVKAALEAGPNRLKNARMREEARHKRPARKQVYQAAPVTAQSKTDQQNQVVALSSKKKSRPSVKEVLQKAPPGKTGDVQVKTPTQKDLNKAADDQKLESKLPPPLPPNDEHPNEDVLKSEAEKDNKTADNDDPTAAAPGYDGSELSLNEPMRNPNLPLFTLSANRNVYTKTMVMDQFNGHSWWRKASAHQWKIEPSDRGVNFSGVLPLQISYDLPIMELPQKYKVEHNLGNFVPIAGVPLDMTLVDDVTVDDNANIRAASPLTKGTEYSVVAEVPVYSLDEMRKHKDPQDDMDPPNADQYLQLPDDQSKDVFDLSTKLVGTDGNRFAKAERICKYLRTNFKYAPKPVFGDKPPANLVDAFLFDAKQGDCKAYASSFVVLCRAAEIPARLTIGFLPGDYDPITATQHVKSKHAHAWAEVYLPPYGWVPFDSTPTGTLPARPEEMYYNYQRLASEAKAYSQRVNVAGTNVLQLAMNWFGYIVAGAGILFAAFALYLCSRAAFAMAKSIAADRKNRHPATSVKRKVLKDLRKIGVHPGPSDTGREIVERLKTVVAGSSPNSQLPNKVADFMEAYNQAYFGRENNLHHLKSLEADISKMCAARKSR